MNSRLGIFFSTVLMLLGIALWSATILADELGTDDPAVHREARTSADTAHREAAREAAERIKAESKLDLDIEFVGRTSVQIAGD